MHGQAQPGVWACPTCLETLRDEARALRRLLAEQVAGASLERGEDELRDSSCMPAIDFYRDSVAEITEKLLRRASAGEGVLLGASPKGPGSS